MSKSKRVCFQVLPVPAGNRPSDGGAVSHQEAAAAGSPVPDFQQGRVLHQRQPARVFRAVPSRAVPTTRVRRRVSAHNGDVGLGATARPAPPWPVRSVGACGPRFRGFLSPALRAAAPFFIQFPTPLLRGRIRLPAFSPGFLSSPDLHPNLGQGVEGPEGPRAAPWSGMSLPVWLQPCSPLQLRLSL